MDPNPLQYQPVDENEPLYRAAMISGVAVGIIIVLVLGINFVIRHANGPAPTVKRDYETSPDDTVNGMRPAMNDEPGVGSSSAGNSGPLPSQSFASTTAQQPFAMGSRPVAPVAVMGDSAIGSSPYYFSEPPSTHHTHGAVMRNWASLSPENLADLMLAR